ncbi:MAG: 50S ribosomal protein L6 [Candidatus Aenigmarchaeota archaeon]|nr:50S ribosomal protein L6 [Candidatus Aenigmarchaeota archaeon]
MVYEQKFSIPEGVSIEKGEDSSISISGEKGRADRVFVYPHAKINITSDTVTVKTVSKRNKDRAVVGTWISHISNMSKGVKEGFVYKLKVVYTHFPVTVTVSGNSVNIKNFLGGRGIMSANIIGDTKVEIKKDDVVVSGINKEDVGQTAANIERACKVKGKDRRVFQDGIYLVNKE